MKIKMWALMSALLIAVGIGFANAQSLNVTSPTNGATVVIGHGTSIQWQTAGIPWNSKVRISLVAMESPFSSQVYVLADTVRNSGTYYWHPEAYPGIQIGGFDCYKILVETEDGAYQSGKSQSFSISYSSRLQVISPNGLIGSPGQTVWNTGTGGTNSVDFLCQGLEGQTVSVALIDRNGYTYDMGVSTTIGLDGKYSLYFVAPVAIPTGACTVMVYTVDKTSRAHYKHWRDSRPQFDYGHVFIQQPG